MHLLLYFLFSILDPYTIELDNGVIVTLSEPVIWNVGDELDVHLNNQLFSYYRYQLVNVSQKSSCLALLPQQSLSEKSYLRRCDSTIYVREDIYNTMESGSYWTLDHGSIPADWEPCDPLIKGFPDVLINLKRNNYIYASFCRYFNLFDDE